MNQSFVISQWDIQLKFLCRQKLNVVAYVSILWVPQVHTWRSVATFVKQLNPAETVVYYLELQKCPLTSTTARLD